jgi:hypothetical protein
MDPSEQIEAKRALNSDLYLPVSPISSVYFVRLVGDLRAGVHVRLCHRGVRAERVQVVRRWLGPVGPS